MEGHKAGEQVKLRVRHSAEERDILLRLDEWKEVPHHVQRLPHATPKQQRILEGMLRGTTDSSGH
jgi:hypothetical protein